MSVTPPASSLDEKVRFLSQPMAHTPRPETVTCRETHMSWVFLAGDRVFKLKKAVRFPYLDFSTIERREAACRAELRLNRRLAPDVYLDVQPLTATGDGLAIGGAGAPLDWLVIMRRLDEARMLDSAIANGWVKERHVDRLGRILAAFYRHANRVFISPRVHLARWLQNLLVNRLILTAPELGLPTGLVRRIDCVQRNFLTRRAALFTERVRAAAIVDGHGDLRPEHIWLGKPIRIIDCLEFNPTLRAVDPIDEVAYLSVECERLGAAWIGDRVRRHIQAGMCDGALDELFVFYRCYRATLRARLTIAHLLEPQPRTPQKWRALARAYLAIAAKDAARLDGFLRKRANP